MPSHSAHSLQRVRYSTGENRVSLIARIADLRFATVSVILHIFIVLLGGSVVLFKVAPSTEDFVAGDGVLVDASDPTLKPPTDTPKDSALPEFSAPAPTAPSMDAIVTNTLMAPSFTVNTSPAAQIDKALARLQSENVGKLAGMGIAVGGVKGGTRSLFGMAHTKDSVGLVGTFYDFKRDAEGKPVPGKGRSHYADIIRAFVKGMAWKVPDEFPHFTSQTRLNSKIFVFKGIPDVDAGRAFESPETKPGLWLAHYTGEVEATRSGSYRLVGWGDNCLIVGFNGKVVLDASDRGYTGEQRRPLGNVNLPGKPGASLFQGDWFEVRSGERIRVDVLLGDEGGIFSAGALIQGKADTDEAPKAQLPNLPAFIVANMDPAEIAVYDFIPPKNLGTVIFQRRKGF